MENRYLEGNDSKFPYNGQLEIEVYFREIDGQSTINCRRFLHKDRNGKTPLIEKLQRVLTDEEKEKLIIIPKHFALLKFIPDYVDDIENKKKQLGRTRGGIEIYDVILLEKEMVDKLRKVLDEEMNKQLPWFNFYRIYLRDEYIAGIDMAMGDFEMRLEEISKEENKND